MLFIMPTMSAKNNFSKSDVHHIATLSNIPISEAEEESLAKGFTTVIEVINKLDTVDTKNVEPTHQVTGLTNVLREDVVDEARQFTQEQALANAPKTHDGYVMVDQILENND